MSPFGLGRVRQYWSNIIRLLTDLLQLS